MSRNVYIYTILEQYLFLRYDQLAERKNGINKFYGDKRSDERRYKLENPVNADASLSPIGCDFYFGMLASIAKGIQGD